jgi:hypothetical protein
MQNLQLPDLNLPLVEANKSEFEGVLWQTKFE